MHELKLISTQFIDPRWFRMPEQTTVAIDHQTVSAFGETLRLYDPSEITLRPGEKVFVWLGRNFYLETEEERQEKQRIAKEREAQRKEANRVCLNKYREEAETFNATLSIPVPWTSAIKDVLSGLSENSMGDGRNKATVNHIVLLDDLQDGRLQRKKYDFLCTSAQGNNGKRWGWGVYNGEDYFAYDGEGKHYQPKITCQTCIKLAQRWKEKKEENR